MLSFSALAQPLQLILPTSNDALLRGEPERFYQYTDRIFKGVRSRPWQGGQYGFSRNQKETSAGIVFTRFHEGVDIIALHRDRRGEPQDTVRAVDSGRVVYANAAASRSSYGKYVVVEHVWSGMPFYSLYAHLSRTAVRTGDAVEQGDMLGVVGYTGRGIDKRRAHLHFEINLLLNQNFASWHGEHFRGRNQHGIYNGLNLAGIDVSALYLEMQREPDLTIERFLRRQPEFFRIRIPNEGALDLHYRYPWLSSGGYDPSAPSLEVGFARSGLPVRVESSPATTSDPVVVYARPSSVAYGDLTKGLVLGYDRPRLSSRGLRHLDLLTRGATRPESGEQLRGRTLPAPDVVADTPGEAPEDAKSSEAAAPDDPAEPPVVQSESDPATATPTGPGASERSKPEEPARPEEAEEERGDFRGW